MTPRHLRVLTLAEHAEHVHDHEEEEHVDACDCHSCDAEMQRALAGAIFQETQSEEWDHLIVDSPERLNPATVAALFEPHPHADHPLGEVVFVQSIISVVETQSFIEGFLGGSRHDAEESLRVLDQVECANCILLSRHVRVTWPLSLELIRLLNPLAESLFFDELLTTVVPVCHWRFGRLAEEWRRRLAKVVERGTVIENIRRMGLSFENALSSRPALRGSQWPFKIGFPNQRYFFTANRMSEVGFLDRVGTRDFSGFELLGGRRQIATGGLPIPGSEHPSNAVSSNRLATASRKSSDVADLDQQASNRCLSACLLTGKELEQGEQSWRLLHGPFPEAEHFPHVH